MIVSSIPISIYDADLILPPKIPMPIYKIPLIAPNSGPNAPIASTAVENSAIVATSLTTFVKVFTFLTYDYADFKPFKAWSSVII